MATEDRCKTAVCTPFGLYEYNTMPFGLKCARATFQRYMDTIFGNLTFCCTYIDDILIYSDDAEQHKAHLQQIFKLIKDNNLIINEDKCVYNM